MKSFLYCLLFLLSLSIYAQDFSNRWTGHYSYFQIRDLSSGEDKIYAASENAIFTFDLNSNETEKFSSVNGLSGESISSIYYSDVYNLIIVGYENGFIEVINEETGDVTTFVDIFEKPTIAPNQKKINSFTEFENRLFVSTAFGIVEFNLEKIEFGDTFLIGPGGTQINILQTEVFDGFIYASAGSNGLIRANVASENLVDFNQWSVLIAGTFNGIRAFDQKLFAWENNNLIRRIDGNTAVTVITASSTINYFGTTETNITIALNDQAIVFDTGLQEVSSIQSNETNSFVSNVATVVDGDVYIGTTLKGLFQTPIDNTTTVNNITPGGPLLNKPFSIEAGTDDLWVVFGEHDLFYNPFPLRERGVSRLKEDSWINISENDIFGATSLTNITIDPDNSEHVLISSHDNGILEILDNTPVKLYNAGNSDLETFIPDGAEPGWETKGIRVNGAAFDKDGDMWFTTALIDNALKRFTPGSGETFDVDLSPIVNTGSELGYGDVVLDRSGNVFVGGYNNGVIGYSVDTGKLIKIVGETSNIPSPLIFALAIDTNNQLWIGTRKGLRVFSNVSNAFSQDNLVTRSIIFEQEDGLPQELLFDQIVSDIEVDGSNNKWLATASSGVFYVSSDGLQTFEHFTTANSPLPSNDVTDISIDNETGAVYFATTKGLLEYKGTATGPEDNLENVIAFPNPVRPGFDGFVTIKGLTSRANVKITDIEGNLVYEEVSQGGSIQWDTTAFGRHKVASGVYLILITGEEQSETTVSKLMIVR